MSLRAFSHKVEELRGWITQSIEGYSTQAAREREVTRGRLSEVKSQMKDLRSHVLAVDSVLNAKFPSRLQLLGTVQDNDRSTFC